jgi:predicted HicB family RNase H-like nuclease
MDTGRKMFTTRLSREAIKQLKILAAHQETSINHLLKKYSGSVKKYEEAE